MNESVTRVFNPDGVLPEEYLIKYPELGDYDETRKLRGVELQWCWYYGSKESPIVKKRKPNGEPLSHLEKCQVTTALIFDKIFKGHFYDEKIIEGLRTGDIPTTWTQAVDFFRRVNSDARSTAKSMIEKMFDQYTDVIEGGPEKFVDKNGDIDYGRYITITKLIRGELPDLIRQKESGFSVTDSFVDEEKEMSIGSHYCEMYLKRKS